MDVALDLDLDDKDAWDDTDDAADVEADDEDLVTDVKTKHISLDQILGTKAISTINQQTQSHRYKTNKTKHAAVCNKRCVATINKSSSCFDNIS